MKQKEKCKLLNNSRFEIKKQQQQQQQYFCSSSLASTQHNKTVSFLFSDILCVCIYIYMYIMQSRGRECERERCGKHYGRGCLI